VTRKPKPRTLADLPPQDVAIATIAMLTQERQILRDGLRDLLAFWDRRDESGWTAADLKRIAEIRALVEP
jgi:hypothetical protein